MIAAGPTSQPLPGHLGFAHEAVAAAAALRAAEQSGVLARPPGGLADTPILAHDCVVEVVS